MTHTELALIEALDALITALAVSKAIDLKAIDATLERAQQKFSSPEFSEAFAALNIIRASTNQDRQKALSSAIAFVTAPPEGAA